VDGAIEKKKTGDIVALNNRRFVNERLLRTQSAGDRITLEPLPTRQRLAPVYVTLARRWQRSATLRRRIPTHVAAAPAKRLSCKHTMDPVGVFLHAARYDIVRYGQLQVSFGSAMRAGARGRRSD
jgi:hypothetical protein